MGDAVRHSSGSGNRTREGALEIVVLLKSERRDGRVVYDSKGTLLSASQLTGR